LRNGGRRRSGSHLEKVSAFHRRHSIKCRGKKFRSAASEASGQPNGDTVHTKRQTSTRESVPRRRPQISEPPRKLQPRTPAAEPIQTRSFHPAACKECRRTSDCEHTGTIREPQVHEAHRQAPASPCPRRQSPKHTTDKSRPQPESVADRDTGSGRAPKERIATADTTGRKPSPSPEPGS
jgi:hypothetical protein